MPIIWLPHWFKLIFKNQNELSFVSHQSNFEIRNGLLIRKPFLKRMSKNIFIVYLKYYKYACQEYFLLETIMEN